MKWWERIMILFGRHAAGDEPSDRVDAAFARYDHAQRGAALAGKAVERVADAQTKRLKNDQKNIRERTDRQKARSHPGETGEVRTLVEDMLARFDRAGQNSEDEGR